MTFVFNDLNSIDLLIVDFQSFLLVLTLTFSEGAKVCNFSFHLQISNSATTWLSMGCLFCISVEFSEWFEYVFEQNRRELETGSLVYEVR